MSRPAVAAVVAACRAEPGALSPVMADALAAAEAWACGEEPTAEEYRALGAALGADERSEAVRWTLAALAAAPACAA